MHSCSNQFLVATLRTGKGLIFEVNKFPRMAGGILTITQVMEVATLSYLSGQMESTAALESMLMFPQLGSSTGEKMWKTDQFYPSCHYLLLKNERPEIVNYYLQNAGRNLLIIIQTSTFWFTSATLCLISPTPKTMPSQNRPKTGKHSIRNKWHQMLLSQILSCGVSLSH